MNDIRNLFEFEHGHQSGIGVKKNEFKVPDNNQISIPTNLFYCYQNETKIEKNKGKIRIKLLGDINLQM